MNNAVPDEASGGNGGAAGFRLAAHIPRWRFGLQYEGSPWLDAAAKRAQVERILPEGDRGNRPRGRRQFGLASLLWLLTISAAVLAIARIMHAGPGEVVVLVCLTVWIW